MSQTPARPPYPGTPRWVKIFGGIVVALVLLFVVLQFTGVGGEHGPGLHTPSGDAGGDTPPIEQEAQPDGPGGHTPPIEHGGQQP